MTRKNLNKRAYTAKRIALLLLCSDVLGFFLSVVLAYSLLLRKLPSIGDAFFGAIVLGFTLIVLACLYLGDAYKPETQMTQIRASARVAISITFSVVVFPILIYWFGLWGKVTLAGRTVWPTAIGMFTIWAISSRFITSHLIQKNIKYRSWLVISHDSIDQFISDFHKLDPLGRFSVLTDNKSSALESGSSEYIGYIDSLRNISFYSAKNWSGVIVTDTHKLTESEQQELLKIRFQGTPILAQEQFYEDFALKVPPSSLRNEWFTFGLGFGLFQERLSKKIKRIIDLVFSFILLVILWPLMLLVALVIKIDSEGPILYSQLRTGLNGKVFRVYKFRSMVNNSENGKAQWAQKNDPRITRVGYFLRITRIDELPQIWNVFKGEMCFVGPRPERPEFDRELEKEIPYYNIRYLVKPGITGWSQVMYGYGSSIEDSYEKVAYDLYYIKHFSIWLDLAIVLKTIRIVLLGKGR